ncbi:M48 family metalloprotease, partial [Acinetobacter baumannii]
TKIRGIHFAGFDCNSSRDKPIAPNGMPDTRRGAIPVDAEPNAFYRWQDNSFTVCAGMLMSSTSEFQLAQVISHELGHSSDAC